MNRRGPWFLTRDKYPTAEDMRRGIIAAAPMGEGRWMFWDMQMMADFAVKNFGSPPLWWTYASELAPDSFALSHS